MSDERAEQAAQFLASEFRAHRMFDSVDASIAPRSIEESYDVQAEYLRLLSDLRGEFGGYKVAYTTAAMQQRSGLKEPGFGRLFANEIYNSPATLKASNYVHLGIECEVAVRLGADLPASGAPYTRESISDAISEVMAGIEVGWSTAARLKTCKASNRPITVSLPTYGAQVRYSGRRWRTGAISILPHRTGSLRSMERWSAKATAPMLWAIPSKRWCGSRTRCRIAAQAYLREWS